MSGTSKRHASRLAGVTRATIYSMLSAGAYLTLEETAEELKVGVNDVRVLVSEQQLPVIEPSGTPVVPRVALDAYQRRQLFGLPAVTIQHDTRTIAELRQAFEEQNGCTPENYMRRWKADEIEDSHENMQISIKASMITKE